MDWSRVKLFYTDFALVPMPEGHRFPMHKYRLLREALLNQEVADSHQFYPAPEASEFDLLRAHDEAYVLGLKHGTLSDKEVRPIGLPMGPALYRRSLISTGGFVAATESALEVGYSALLAGGTHHAHRASGEGFCVFNDFAVAGLKLIEEKKVKRILILDLDVHQGNGNSSILGHRDDIFICSIHGERNYPFRKVPSHLDVALPAETTDDKYLEVLTQTLKKLPSAEMILYQAGVDILKSDKLGTFHISHEGIKQRDRTVFEWIQQRSIPVAQAIGGGYADPIEDSIKAYVGTIQAAREVLANHSNM
jgi:acetoin utilization deacetylase AcuC-like enzyme